MRSKKIIYRSTNDLAMSSTGVGFRDALFMGLAPDGGLFVPDHLPVFKLSDLKCFSRMSYPEIASAVLAPFTSGVISQKDLRAICNDAYDFDVPLEKVEDKKYIMRLDRGPTASFKDFAARWMARAMQVLRTDNRPITILVATSGDTGGAVGHAFLGLKGIKVFLLYPEKEISPSQKQQMDSIGGNVRTVSVAGKFDECQALVKQAFMDDSLKHLHLTSANSISIGRILPQMIYYFYAWSRVAAKGEPVVFSVPSGNFGNSFGCELARRMGLPVERLIIAVNENDEFPLYMDSGKYRPVSPSRMCLSNAMNVGNPSNLARYAWAYGGRITREGVMEKSPDIRSMRSRIHSISVSDKDTKATMKSAYKKLGILLEPHGAVGWFALQKLGKGIKGPAVCLETAHPAKFSEIMEDVLGVKPEVPPSLCFSKKKSVSAVKLPVDYSSLKEYLNEALWAESGVAKSAFIPRTESPESRPDEIWQRKERSSAKTDRS